MMIGTHTKSTEDNERECVADDPFANSAYDHEDTAEEKVDS